MNRNTLLAAAAMEMVGAPFRLHGRDPQRGLDCAGLVIAALGKIGIVSDASVDYRLRCLEIERVVSAARKIGLNEMSYPAPAEPGDILLLTPGPAQFHLGIIGLSAELIHAHAGLGRVVITPPPTPWSIVRQWRLDAN